MPLTEIEKPGEEGFERKHQHLVWDMLSQGCSLAVAGVGRVGSCVYRAGQSELELYIWSYECPHGNGIYNIRQGHLGGDSSQKRDEFQQEKEDPNKRFQSISELNEMSPQNSVLRVLTAAGQVPETSSKISLNNKNIYNVTQFWNNKNIYNVTNSGIYNIT